ncbi:DUF756 domain-containing protein [Pseudomonas otitidis]|uniref:DUF756 domain-containing protein n=1 Tax=Metapseudomonas otitidis TaxID=319939 RepID=A0A7X3HDQ8_9GAMM|nr:DUF756 domain-containing protein [Pseudomonas otitidis]
MLQVYELDSDRAPKRYAVATHRRLHDRFIGGSSGGYLLKVHAPNSFLRVFSYNPQRRSCRSQCGKGRAISACLSKPRFTVHRCRLITPLMYWFRSRRS